VIIIVLVYQRDFVKARRRFVHGTLMFEERRNWTKETLICWPRGCNTSGVCDMENTATLVTLRTVVYEPHCA
jgi:hypothetical protein